MNLARKRAGLLVGLIAAFTLGAQTAAHAHEPLWGETPQTFAFGVIHPEVRFALTGSNGLFRGGLRVENGDGLRLSRQETILSLQYAFDTSRNIRLEIPAAVVTATRLVDGALRETRTSGLGDAVLSLKNRYRADFGPDFKKQFSYLVGVQLPTGAHGGRNPDGTRLMPSEQPGSGNFGLALGWAFDYERLQDTVWVSAHYQRDLSGRDRKGDELELDAAYGYWVKRANRPQDLGIILAAGPHLQIAGRDRVSQPTHDDSGGETAGIQATLIATKGQYQGRIGFLVPVYRHFNGTQLGAGTEFRAGFEALL
jgi:hypothetical protein